MSKVSVVLNCFRRSRWLEEQISALDTQTIKPIEILLWKNFSENQFIPENLLNRLIISDCSSNLGVWARFSYALNCKGDYICILDDDTIPGKKWIENCLNSFNQQTGLYGTVGVNFGDDLYSWDKIERIGWCNPNNNIEKVDIVGHSWFFPRDFLSIFWRELPPVNLPMIIGEDIHFSHMIQKYTSFGTYVPPHPLGKIDYWGSVKGDNYGHSPEGITMNTYQFNDNLVTAGQLMGAFLKNKVDNGFKLKNMIL